MMPTPSSKSRSASEKRHGTRWPKSVAAFRSTLQEAREADLLLHVIDASDPERNDRIAQVDEVLASIGAQDVPQIAVYNKIDRTGEHPHAETGEGGRIDRVWLSAHSGAGVDLLVGGLTLGAAALAGLATGFWPGLDALAACWKLNRRFEPQWSDSHRSAHRARWREAVDRSRGWARD